jgi:hypothetical protein
LHFHETPDQRQPLTVQYIVVFSSGNQKSGTGIGFQVSRMFGKTTHQYHGPVSRIECERNGGWKRKSRRFAQMGSERARRTPVQQIERSLSRNSHQTSPVFRGRGLPARL